MNRVRKAFNNFMNHERYSRFTLQTEQDGERRVEVKLSEDGLDGDAEANGGSPTFRPAPRGLSRRTLCILLATVLLFFFIGYLMAYKIHKKPPCENKTVYRVEYKHSDVLSEEEESSLTWLDIANLLEKKLTSQAFTKSLSEFEKVTPGVAGSSEDSRLGNYIFDHFKRLDMEPWTDVHQVRLQTPDRNKSNIVSFGKNNFEPQGFLAYSRKGRAEGRLVYANYGNPEDFEVLARYKIEVNGCVVLMRAGRISFAQKVANAEGKGAVGVLIHPNVDDFDANTELFGHVHFGSGDPYTPGFPSFKHTMFPPTKSSGLPNITAQTITYKMAKDIAQTIGGPVADADSGFEFPLGGLENIAVEVNNELLFKEIHNVFGVIKGFVDPDQYVVLGAQRDAWGKGYARATVGTTALTELAKVVREMVENDEFRPRRSIVFASWSAGEYGVGATEWLEAYMSSLDKNVLAYISLDGIVEGHGSFYTSASPLLHSLIENTLRSINSPTGTGSVYDMGGRSLLRSMSMDDPAYPFLAASGIPSISFHFTSPNKQEYAYYNTILDNKNHLDYAASQKTPLILATAAQIAGQMALKLVYDHVINFDTTRYKKLLNSNVYRISNHVNELKKSGKMSDLNTEWLDRAVGSFARAAEGLDDDIENTDMTDPEACRLLNDRIMRIESALLSPYASPVDTPYRHLLFGQGPHTLAAITEMTDDEQLHTQLALATWNLHSCANAMAANVWDINI